MSNHLRRFIIIDEVGQKSIKKRFKGYHVQGQVGIVDVALRVLEDGGMIGLAPRHGMFVATVEVTEDNNTRINIVGPITDIVEVVGDDDLDDEKMQEYIIVVDGRWQYHLSEPEEGLTKSFSLLRAIRDVLRILEED